MFTGLIEHLGQVHAVQPSPTGKRLGIDLGPLSVGLEPGQSIAVDGVCLTVSALQPGQAQFDVIRTTLQITTLERLAIGSEVNLERPITMQTPLGGHLLSGHVDGLATLEAWTEQGQSRLARFRAEKTITDYLIPKGSVAVNGVSLTVAELSGETFCLALIPETLQRTNLGRLRPGQLVNIETDLIGKYVAKFLASQPRNPLSEQTLREHGFV